MTRRAAWAISGVFLLIAVVLLVYLWLYVASANRNIRMLTTELSDKQSDVRHLTDDITALRSAKDRLAGETLKLSNRLGLTSKTSAELRNTLKGDRDYFDNLAGKYVNFCNEGRLQGCEYFDLQSHLLIARLDSATLRLSADSQEDYKYLDSIYTDISTFNDCLFLKFPDREAAERGEPSRKAKCSGPESIVGPAISRISGITDVSSPPVARSELLSWSSYDWLSFRVFGLEGRAFANWKMGNLSDARQFIKQAQKIGNGFTSVRVTAIKLDCAIGNSPDEAQSDIRALQRSLRARIDSPTLSDVEKRNARVGLDQVIHDAELYATCRLPNAAI